VISYPPVIINEYIASKISQKLSDRYRGSLKFFPTRPTSLDTLIKSNPGQTNDVYVVYDRMFRVRRSAFPHIKQEQLIYYLYKMNGDPESLIETVQVIYDLLDREDESAQEINAWISSKVNSSGMLVFGSGRGQKIFKPVFFHKFKVLQLEEARDIENFDSMKTFSASKMLINYDYHTINYS
jgi:hypothetical protein